MRLVDTNILIYAVSRREVDAPKKAMAEIILKEPDLALSVQVLQEFYSQSIRPRGPAGLTHQEALESLAPLMQLPIQPVTRELLTSATELCDRYRISYWDAAILAAAKTLGCDAVYSEDLSHSQDYDGVRVINPFLEQSVAE